MTTFTVNDDGSISLPLDKLTPTEAFALVEFINTNRPQIEAAQEKARTRQGFSAIALRMAHGLPAPDCVRVGWDGKVEVDFRTTDDFTAWFDALYADGGDDDVRTHPELGTRAVIESDSLRVEGPWDRVPVEVTA